MWIIPGWFHNTKMYKPFLILVCRSWACQTGCLPTLLGRFQPSSFHWLTLSVFNSIPANLPARDTLPLAPSWVLCHSLFFLASISASQVHGLGITFHFGLSLSPCTRALSKSHRVHLHNTVSPAHYQHPPAQPLPCASPWPCQLWSQAA